MKGPTKTEEATPKLYETKIGKPKRFVGTPIIVVKTQTPTTFDEAKACCKARKRKERQESISSLCQERKVIRSNSEERPEQKKYVENNKNCIRRVSSSEDVQCPKVGWKEKNSVSPHRGGDKLLCHEDYDYEKRRSHERFSRPLTIKNKKTPNKRLKIRYLSRTKYKPEFSTDTKDHHKKIINPQGSYPAEPDNKNAEHHEESMQIHEKERDRSPSPLRTPVTPVLDLSTLHEQIDCSEPMLSQTSRQINENIETMPSLSIASNRLLSSPRNSIIATHRIYLDPDIPQTNSTLSQNPQNPVDERLQKLTKQINSLKKKIKKYESEFEVIHGYKPSHLEKMSDKNVKKLYSELSKLKKDQRQLTEISTKCSLLNGNTNEQEKMDMVSLKVTITEIEKKLAAKREADNRCYNIEDMTSEQLMDEKVVIQKALLYLESIHGRPNTREDRDMVRPFYDRYRTLKRMVSKLSGVCTMGNELATIHENEAMNFITPTSSTSQSNDTESEKTTLIPSVSTDSDTDSSVGDNLHSLTKEELLEQIRIATEEKKELRRKIKEFELEIQMKSGRMIQKEDKAPMESVYITYKKTKAKLRLLEALLGKQ